MYVHAHYVFSGLHHALSIILSRPYWFLSIAYCDVIRFCTPFDPFRKK